MAVKLVTLLTDFGTADPFVGIMKGVMLGVEPQLRIVDLTHAIPPQDVVGGALALRAAVPFFPAGTVHVAIVDPGVGSSRWPIVIETTHACLVGPDNGVLPLAADRLGSWRAHRIERPDWYRSPVSQTFHGRDVFAPVAAHLAAGAAVEECGPHLHTPVELVLPRATRCGAEVVGEVVYVDHFGNLVTNIEATLLDDGVMAGVAVGDQPVAGPVTAYSAVPVGTALAIVGSWGMLEIAVRNGNAAAVLGAGRGTAVTVRRRDQP